MYIQVHQAPFDNSPVTINVNSIKGQTISISDAAPINCKINTTSRSFLVIETKGKVDLLIKEARRG